MSLHALYGIKGTICALNKLIITSRYQMVHAHVCIKASTLQMHWSIKRDVNSELPELVQLTFWPCANVSAIYLQNKRSTEGKTKTSKKTWVSIPRILVLFLHSFWNCITPQLKDQHSNVNSNLLENYRLQSIMGNFMQVPCSSTSACFGPIPAAVWEWSSQPHSPPVLPTKGGVFQLQNPSQRGTVTKIVCQTWKWNCGQTPGSSCRAERRTPSSLSLAAHHCLV